MPSLISAMRLECNDIDAILDLTMNMDDNNVKSLKKELEILLFYSSTPLIEFVWSCNL